MNTSMTSAMPFFSPDRAPRAIAALRIGIASLLLPLAVVSCGGGGGGGAGFAFFAPASGGNGAPPADAPTYAVGGSVSGLLGSGLVLQQAGSADVAVAADGRFVFGDRRAKGAGYAVTVKQQPANPTQTCSVERGAGTVGDADVSDIAVVCANTAYTVSVKVTGLASPDLVLQNNAGDDLPVAADGTFSFATPVASGAGYGVTVKTRPSALQACVVHDAFGTAGASGAAPVEVRCTQAGAARFAYVPNESSNTVSAFQVDAVGMLSTATPFITGGTPEHMAVDSSGRFAYTANWGSGTVSTFTIDTSTGALLPPVAVPVPGGSPRFIALEPQGRFAYVMGNGGITRFLIDPATGQLGASVRFLVGGGSNSRWMGIDSASRFAYAALDNGAVEVLAIDPASGVLSHVQSVTVTGSTWVTNVALEPSGRFAYVTTGTGASKLFAYAIDARTGMLSEIASVTTGNTGRGLDVDPTGRFVYVSNLGDANVSAFAIDARTGVPTPVPGSPFAIAVGTAPTSVTVDRTGRFAYTANQVSNSVSRFDIDPATGALANPMAVSVGGNGPQFVVLTK
jgi:6-phosphogluconolactonase